MKKFDVVRKLVVETKNNLPEYFFSDSAVEAEKLYKEFNSTLNGFAYSYSVATGLDKSDLFCEALIELAEAKKDFDPSRSDNFKSYAIFRIKDALNVYVRKNATSVAVPNYIKKANSNITTIKDTLIKYDMFNYGDSITSHTLESVDMEKLQGSDKEILKRAIKSLTNAAQRTNMLLEKLVQRAEHIPMNEEYVEESIESSQSIRDLEKFNASLIVHDLKKKMTLTELDIAEGIMEGKTLKQIGDDNNRTAAWVSRKLKGLRNKLAKEL
jgi:RNA polymerase sigma factor (sigma-70 family)